MCIRDRYIVRVTVAADDDYNEASATADFAITYLAAPNPAYTLSGTEGTGDWYTSDVTIKPPEGYTCLLYTSFWLSVAATIVCIVLAVRNRGNPPRRRPVRKNKTI